MTIKEVEKELGLSRVTIRFYEKENLLTPQRSGNSYREYDEEDVAVLMKIVILRKLGFSLSEIKEQEERGNKFLEIVNDSIGYEKQIFYKYFSLLDVNGDMLYSDKEVIWRVIKGFFVAGVIGFLFSGIFSGEWKAAYFISGLSTPILALGFMTLFGLPWHFLKKKYPNLSAIAKKIIYIIVIGIPVVVSFVILAFAAFNH